MLGRDDEVELLESLLRYATEGRGGGVLLLGEPGIGKTATARHFEAVGSWDTEPPPDLAMWLVPDLVEALVRLGELDRAAASGLSPGPTVHWASCAPPASRHGRRNRAR